MDKHRASSDKTLLGRKLAASGLAAVLAVLSPGLEGWQAAAQVYRPTPIQAPVSQVPGSMGAAFPGGPSLEGAAPAAPAAMEGGLRTPEALAPLDGSRARSTDGQVPADVVESEAAPVRVETGSERAGARSYDEGSEDRAEASGSARDVRVSAERGWRDSADGFVKAARRLLPSFRGQSAPARADLEVPETAVRAEASASLAAPIEKSFQTPAAVPVQARAAAPAAREERIEKRSALFPAVFSGAAGTLWLSLKAAASSIMPSSLALGAAHAPLALGIAGAGVGALLVAAAADLALFGYAKWKGRSVTPEQFWDFVQAEVVAGRLDPNLAGPVPGKGVIRSYRLAPPAGPASKKQASGIAGRVDSLKRALSTNRSLWFTYGFNSGASIYVRQELAAVPWLFRLVVAHELSHLKGHMGMAPPAQGSWLGRILSRFVSEFRARVMELSGRGGIKKSELPMLFRVMRASQVSMRLSGPFEVLAVDAGEGQAELTSTVDFLSGGKAKLSTLKLDGSLAEFESHTKSPADRNRYWSIILNGASRWLPAAGDIEAKALDRAFKQLESTLAENVGKRVDAQKASERLQQVWRHSMGRVRGVGAMKVLDSSYRALSHRGFVILPFDAKDKGLDTYERLLRFYEAYDGGRFGVTRVDLSEGGHALVLQKLEPRVNLWLHPAKGKSISKSLTNVFSDPVKKELAAALLKEMGLGRYARLFADGRVEIRHVFGADVGQNSVYVTVPRELAPSFRKVGEIEGEMKVEESQEGFEPHIIVSAPLVHADGAWALGYRGEGINIAVVDTGLDEHHPDFQGRFGVKVMVKSGPEDHVGHGTHVTGIISADGGAYQGMANKAHGEMYKVFADGGGGASDGDIMAALTDAVTVGGADVISMSLGGPGGPNDKLAQFVSGITQQRNVNGRFPVVFASAGNSGPFHQTVGQPAAGEKVIAVGSATKGEVDGLPDVSWFSSNGFVWDSQLRRWMLKPEIMGIGGNVTSVNDFAKGDMFKHGVESTKSQNMAPGASDTPDGKHTRMSGTSMSAPMVAGIGALVVQVGRKFEAAAGELGVFFKENSPLAVRAVLLRSAQNLNLPIPSGHGLGLADAKAAVELTEKIMGSSAPAKLLSRLFGRASEGRAPPQPGMDWEWVKRYDKIVQAGSLPFQQADQARSQAIAKSKAEVVSQAEALASQQVFQKTLSGAKDAQLPFLIESLKDPVWLNRAMAAFGLMNFRSGDAVMALMDAGLNDEDSRVRQMALRAVGNTPGHEADALLRSALTHKNWDVQLYAALALAQHGDKQGIAKIAGLLSDKREGEGKRVRFSAAYVAGEIAAMADAGLAEALSKAAADEREIDSVRQAAAVGLAEIAAAAPDAVTDNALIGAIDAAGPKDMMLAGTFKRFFAQAGRKPETAKRFKDGAVKERVAAYVADNKGWISKPGPIGELVQFLARLSGLPVAAPSKPADPQGKGIKGVDPRLGPIQLIVRIPHHKGKIEKFSHYTDNQDQVYSHASAFGFDAATMDHYQARVRATLPHHNGVTLEVADSKKAALMIALKAKGYEVREAKAIQSKLKDTGPLSGMPQVWDKYAGEGVTIAIVDEGGDVDHPAFAGRIRAVKNFSGEGDPGDVTKEEEGHGTHTGGIAAGESVDGSPYRGMAPKARLVFAKVLGANGGTDAQVMEGQAWAASLTQDPSKDPIIINESLGGPGTAADPLAKSVTQIVLKGVGFVAAAGNEGPKGEMGIPASAPLAIAVGAADKAGKLTDYSTRAPEGATLNGWLDYGGGAFFGKDNPYEIISALSTKLANMGDKATTVWWPNKENGKPLYQYMSGTSMAAPHTAGKMAVLVGIMLKQLTTLPEGYWLWLTEHVKANVTKLEGYKPNEVGYGIFNNMPQVVDALLKRLENPDQVKSEAKALQDAAMSKYGPAPAQPQKKGIFSRIRG